MGSPDSFRLDGVEQRLWRIVLHDYRLSRVACFRRVNLAGCRCGKRREHGKYTRQNYVGLQTCGMYWTFVVALWPILYGLVYLY